MQHCGNCDYYREVMKDKQLGNCLESPPVVQFIPIELGMNASTIQRGGVPSVQMSAASARPQVFAIDGCSRWKSAIA